jgi:hypothetical protein
MRKILLLTIGLVLCLSASVEAAMTYGAAYYRKRISNAGTGYSDTDPISLFMNEVETTFDGTSGVTSWIFTPGTEPSSPSEGQVYYDSAGNNLKLYTGAAFVDIDLSGASSLATAYTAGSKILAPTLEVEIEVADSSNNPALRLDFDDATTNAQDVLVIDNAGDDAAAVSIQINGTAGYDIQGTSDTWQVSIAGVAGLVGATIGNSDLVFTEPTTNDVTLLADADAQLTISATSKEDIDLNLATADTLTVTSSTGLVNVNWGNIDAHNGLNALAFDGGVANTITQTGTGGADDLTISQATSGQDASLILQSSGTGTDALSLISSVADIKANSADNIDIDAADNITVDTADGSYTLTIGGSTNGDYTATVADVFSLVVVDTITIQNTEATKDITVNSVLGSIAIEAEEDAANAILITADGGTSSTLRLHNDTGTAATSIDLLSDVGGITATASAGPIVLTGTGATAGDVTISAGDVMTLTSVDTKIFDGAAAETWVIEGTADASEATIVFTDPTADVTWTFPTAATDTFAVMASTLATNAPEIANSVTGGTNQLIFEGATADASECILTATDATADTIYTLPDAAAATYGLVTSTLAANGVDIVNAVWGGTNQIIMEGATADAFETIITPTDATADATITLPDDTGSIGYTPTGKTTKDATNAAIPITHAIVEGTSGAASAWSLANGENGQVLTVVIVTDGGEATITPATATGWATAVLTDDIDTITMMYIDDVVGWIVLGTASDGTNLVALTQ